MSDAIRLLGQWRDVTARYVRVGGVWRKVSSVAVRTGGAWRSTQGSAPAFSASAPGNAYGFQGAPNNQSVGVTTPLVTITVNGGTAPYTYSWTKVNGDPRVAASSPQLASTRFTATLRGEIVEATFNWTASDANGSTAAGTIFVQLEAGDNR